MKRAPFLYELMWELCLYATENIRFIIMAAIIIRRAAQQWVDDGKRLYVVCVVVE